MILLRFLVIPGVCLAIFFGLQHTLGTLGAAALSTLLFVGWFVFNVRAATTGLVKACMRSYFIQRARGASTEEALDGILQARYRFSPNKQQAVKIMFQQWQLSQTAIAFEGEDEKLKILVYVIFCHENGLPPPETNLKIIRTINKVYASMTK